ncbi:MAG: succinylglutamate desuccinylase/aspartoacylase family protein [Alphaproteobacteria bacterium]
MSHEVSRHPLVAMSPGTERHHVLHRFGEAGARPKAYLQAAVHADEIPGILVLHHLLRRLVEADRAGDVGGEVVVVPFANPIGLSQRLKGELLGRYEFHGGSNFNRDFPDLDEAAIGRVEGLLGADADENVRLIRAALGAELDQRASETDIEAQRLFLMRHAVDADIVLDLHCDSEAVLHLFLGNHLWPAAADLSAQLGSRATILAVDSGGDPFDEACSRPWWALAAHYGDRFPVPAACLSATVELRGTADVGDHYAIADAANLYRFLQRRGVIAGDPGPLPKPECEATPLEGVDHLVAPFAGVVSYRKRPGDEVCEGEVVADLIDPAAADPTAESARRALASRIDGVLFGRHLMKLARAGERICKIAGREPLPGRVPGKLMLD